MILLQRLGMGRISGSAGLRQADIRHLPRKTRSGPTLIKIFYQDGGEVISAVGAAVVIGGAGTATRAETAVGRTTGTASRADGHGNATGRKRSTNTGKSKKKEAFLSRFFFLLGFECHCYKN